MGNITCKTACVIGAVIVTIAKPACKYTAELVSRETNKRLDELLSAVQHEHTLLDSVLRTEAALQEDIVVIKQDILLLSQQLFSAPNAHDSIKDAIDRMEKIIQKLPTTMNLNNEVLTERVLELMPQAAAKAEGHDSILSRIEKALEKLPKEIDEANKRYSTYLHDEHTEIYELISKHAVSNARKSVSLPPSPRGIPRPALSAKKTDAMLQTALKITANGTLTADKPKPRLALAGIQS